MKKIYIFGNPLIPDDSIPFQFIDRLKQLFPTIQFEVVDPNENFPPKNERDLIILDTIKGIRLPMIITLKDLEKRNSSPISPHDYDLLFHLLLLKKLKKIESVKIIGVPFDTTFPTIIAKVVKIISSLSSRNAQHRTYTGQTP